MKLILLTLCITLISSCGFKSVDNGNVAIVIDSFSKNVHDNPLNSGLTFKPFTSTVEVSATDVRLELSDLQPKDKKGMKFEDVDVTITLRLDKEKAVTLYKETKEVNYVEHLDNDVLGYQKLKQIATAVVTDAFLSFNYQEFISSREKLDKKIQELLQKEVDQLLYKAYKIKDVQTIKTNLMPDIEKAFQNRSLVSQKELLVKSRERLMLKEMELKEKEMFKMKNIAKKIGVKVKDLMDYQVQMDRNEVLSDLSKGSGAKVLLQVDK